MSKYVLVEEEPKHTSAAPPSKAEFSTALNWYNCNKEEKDAAKYLKCDVSRARNHLTLAWITRLMERGFTLPEGSENALVDLKARFDSSKAVVDDTQPQQTVNVQERIAHKTDTYIAELEGMIDEYGVRGMKPFNAYDWFIKNDVKPIHSIRIAEYFKHRLEILEDEVNTYKEAYSKMGKAKIKSIMGVMHSIIDDAGRLSSNINKNRKPRKKKPVSHEKMVAKLNYKEKDDTYKLQSINPTLIVGAEQIWVFNTKTRKLGVYSAQDADGLRVKGSTILNYSEPNSQSKTIRKPEKVLTSVLDGGKITLRKLMDNINSKPSPLNGRLNKDTVILRAIR